MGWAQKPVTPVSMDFTDGHHKIVVEGAPLTKASADVVLAHQKALIAICQHFDADIIVRPKGARS